MEAKTGEDLAISGAEQETRRLVEALRPLLTKICTSLPAFEYKDWVKNIHAIKCATDDDSPPPIDPWGDNPATKELFCMAMEVDIRLAGEGNPNSIFGQVFPSVDLKALLEKLDAEPTSQDYIDTANGIEKYSALFFTGYNNLRTVPPQQDGPIPSKKTWSNLFAKFGRGEELKRFASKYVATDDQSKDMNLPIGQTVVVNNPPRLTDTNISVTAPRASEKSRDQALRLPITEFLAMPDEQRVATSFSGGIQHIARKMSDTRAKILAAFMDSLVAGNGQTELVNPLRSRDKERPDLALTVALAAAYKTKKIFERRNITVDGATTDLDMPVHDASLRMNCITKIFNDEYTRVLEQFFKETKEI